MLSFTRQERQVILFLSSLIRLTSGEIYVNLGCYERYYFNLDDYFFRANG